MDHLCADYKDLLAKVKGARKYNKVDESVILTLKLHIDRLAKINDTYRTTDDRVLIVNEFSWSGIAVIHYSLSLWGTRVVLAVALLTRVGLARSHRVKFNP